MRYMHNFLLGAAPFNGDADILPYDWVWAHRVDFASGLPFSLTLIGILLAHEFGHYAACRYYGVRSTLPWLLPAPSLSGTFGAVIRLQSSIRTRAALLMIGASGPIVGFAVAIGTILLGLSRSTYATKPILKVQPTAIIYFLQNLAQPHANLLLLVPHPILSASWIGILITALNLIPAGQLDGGHIMYAMSPRAHRMCTRMVIGLLFVFGIFFWAGWILWAAVLLLPSMRHPRIPDPAPLTRAQLLLVPACAVIFLFSFTYRPFYGFSLYDFFIKLPGRYHH